MWPFRKKKALPLGPSPVAPDWADQVEHHLAVQADMRRRLEEQIARIAATPMPRFVWTPLINGYGQVIALAWKNDAGTATRLLEEPAEGRA